MTKHTLLTQPRWVVLTALALVGVGSLTGCGLTFADPSQTPSASPSASDDAEPQSEPQADPAPESESPEPTETETEPADAGDEIGASTPGRDELIALAVQTIPCSDGLDVASHGSIVRVEGACEAITISADAAVVITDDVTTLTITGTGTVVNALEIADLRITGDVNDVRWSGATPAVTDEGTANTMGAQR